MPISTHAPNGVRRFGNMLEQYRVWPCGQCGSEVRADFDDNGDFDSPYHTGPDDVIHTADVDGVTGYLIRRYNLNGREYRTREALVGDRPGRRYQIELLSGDPDLPTPGIRVGEGTEGTCQRCPEGQGRAVFNSGRYTHTDVNDNPSTGGHRAVVGLWTIGPIGSPRTEPAPPVPTEDRYATPEVTAIVEDETDDVVVTITIRTTRDQLTYNNRRTFRSQINERWYSTESPVHHAADALWRETHPGDVIPPRPAGRTRTNSVDGEPEPSPAIWTAPAGTPAPSEAILSDSQAQWVRVGGALSTSGQLQGSASPLAASRPSVSTGTPMGHSRSTVTNTAQMDTSRPTGRSAGRLDLTGSSTYTRITQGLLPTHPGVAIREAYAGHSLPDSSTVRIQLADVVQRIYEWMREARTPEFSRLRDFMRTGGLYLHEMEFDSRRIALVAHPAGQGTRPDNRIVMVIAYEVTIPHISEDMFLTWDAAGHQTTHQEHHLDAAVRESHYAREVREGNLQGSIQRAAQSELDRREAERAARLARSSAAINEAYSNVNRIMDSMPGLSPAARDFVRDTTEPF